MFGSLVKKIFGSANDAKNKRTRPSILIKSQNVNLLVDTSPDLRTQCLREKINKIDAILYTHDHSDHTAGIDDIKHLIPPKKTINAYMGAEIEKSMHKRFFHLFNSTNPLYSKRIESCIFTNHFNIGDIEISPFLQIHGPSTSYGFRFGDLAYSTDFNQIPERSLKKLQGIKIWILDCLRYFWSPTHSNLDNTLNMISKIKPELAILTHMSHETEYHELARILPNHIVPAYDGMKITY